MIKVLLWIMKTANQYIGEYAHNTNNHRMADFSIVIYDSLNEIGRMV